MQTTEAKLVQFKLFNKKSNVQQGYSKVRQARVKTGAQGINTRMNE